MATNDLDDDLDNDLDNDLDQGTDTNTSNDENAPKVGEQDDGSVIVELDEENTGNTDDKTKNISTDDNTATEDTEREKIREQRRQERQERKQRQKEKEERIRRELESERAARRQLEERMAVMERRATGSEMAQIDKAINDTKNAYNHYKNQIQVGQEANNGAMVAEATEKMMLARQRHQELTNVKNAFQQRQQQPQPLDPNVVRHAREFAEKHTWYRTDGQDDDSVITRTIDNRLAAEGWDPKTPEYWVELESRVKKYLPHRAKGATVQHNDDGTSRQQSNVKPRSTVAGSGRESSASNAAKSTFKLSPERVKAMKEAGSWDDPKKRNDMIRYYRDYDKQNGRN